MSFRTRLQTFVESRQKIQIWYGMGCHNTVTGRVLSVDHDHIDVESYSHENDGQIHVRRILVPLHLVLHIDITSAEIGDEDELTNIEDRQENKSLPSLPAVIDLPDTPKGYGIRVLSQLNASAANRFSRLTLGPGGIYFACEGSIWFIEQGGQLIEYARIRGNNTIASLRFDSRGADLGGSLERHCPAVDHVAGLFRFHHAGGGTGPHAWCQSRKRHQSSNRRQQ